MDSIIQTILKLLEKGKQDKNDNAAEREICLNKANELMEKHNLSMSEIKGHDIEDPNQIEISEETTDFDSDPWKRSIIRAVAMLFNCHVLYTPYGRKYRAKLIGTQENIAVAKSMIDYYLSSISKEAKSRYGSAKGSTHLKKSFSLAAGDELLARVKDMIQAEKFKEDASMSTALVLVRNSLQKANEGFLSKNYPNRGTMRSRSITADASAYAQGKEYGAGLGISRGKAIAKKV